MDSVSIQLLGKFSVRCNGAVFRGIEARRVQELFCHLLLHRTHLHPRETLAGQLWGDSPTGVAKKALRQTLWQLQTVLEGLGTPNAAPILLIDPEQVQINPAATFWLDIAAFESTFNRVRDAAGESLDDELARELESAVTLYQGDLLEGCYQDWCIYERERFQLMYLTLLEKLILHAEAKHAYDSGITYGMQLLRFERGHERTHRQLMRLYYQSGDRAMALRQYERCVTALKEELNVEPSRQTIALYQQLQADDPQLAASLQSAEAAPTPCAPHGTLQQILHDLIRISGLLADAQGQIAKDIKAVEHILKDRC